MAFRSLQMETVAFRGHDGAKGEAYYARPSGAGRFPGVVIIHHFPGWDEWTAEVARKFAHHGYAAIAPNLYFRLGDGGSEEVVARARAEGGVADDQLVGDVAGAMEFLHAQPSSNGKVGAIGFCSGGRQAYLAACRITALDAVVDCWGANVVVDDPSKLTPKNPVAAIDLTAGIRCPVLGLFGNEDTNPSPDHVNRVEAALKRFGKTYEFHRYDGAGHAFFAWYRTNYRQEQAQDGWSKVLAFYGKHLVA
ncbi:MAG: dienelactone hydrolase family protein [Proteobacteria bacterium]|nr:dienelactone hydrolase family protein [Pseudomonadota bacterium]MBI3505766.1 dienelactone hydrolase family protein [Pseudomonadota bacterium]